jgi:hypothetical protein
MDYLTGSYVSRVARLAWFAFLTGALAGLVTLAIQILSWLKTARWPAFALSDAFGTVHPSLPRTSWLGLEIILEGLQRVLERMLAIPLALGFVTLGALTFLALTLVAAAIARRERRRAR